MSIHNRILSILTIVLLCVVWTRPFAESDADGFPPDYHISHFPVVRQHDGISCGPTCLWMVLHKYGRDVSMCEVEEHARTKWWEIDDRPIGLTTPDNMIETLNHFGVATEIKKGSVISLKAEVSKGKPIILLVRSSDWTWHYIVVIGYSRNNNLIIADPALGNRMWLKESELCGCWSFDRDMEGGHVTKPCPVCSGTGNWLPWSGLSFCPFCGGTGGSFDVPKFCLMAAGVQPMTMLVPVN